MGYPRWEYLDWEDNQSDQATGTRIRLMFPYHLPASDPPLPLDPPLDSSLVRAHELAALVETTLVNRLMTDDNPRNRLTVRGIAVDDMMVCMKMQLAHAWIGTWFWVDLRGAAAPRLTVDRKTALLREDIQDWPSLFEGVFQRWCDYLQRLLNQYSLQLASGLLSVLGIDAALHPKAPITPQLSRWKLEITDRSVAWHGQWLTALLIQEMVIFNNQFQQAGSGIFHTINTLSLISNHASNLNRDRTLDRALVLTLARTITRTLNPARNTALLHDNNSYLDLDPVLRLDFDRDLNPAPNLDRAFASTDVYVCWELSLALHLLPEAFADNLSQSFPALGICGLKGRAGDGWLVAPGWIEWDVDPVTAEVHRESPKQHWSQRLIDKNYDLVFPLTHIPLGRLRRDCPKWRSDRRYRALGILAYFLFGSEEWFKKQGQNFLDLLSVPHIHALMPRPELWLKPFDDWTETDWSTCGLSALWDIESGVVYWAEGAHHADDMKRVGKPIEQFIVSKT